QPELSRFLQICSLVRKSPVFFPYLCYYRLAGIVSTSQKQECHYMSQKILIIEDEEGIIHVINLYLKDAGYTVVIPKDGADGLALHAREHPDLVILDIMLPAIDGFEVCRRMRTWSKTPILILTARGDEEDRINGLELGAD